MFSKVSTSNLWAAATAGGVMARVASEVGVGGGAAVRSTRLPSSSTVKGKVLVVRTASQTWPRRGCGGVPMRYLCEEGGFGMHQRTALAGSEFAGSSGMSPAV